MLVSHHPASYIYSSPSQPSTQPLSLNNPALFFSHLPPSQTHLPQGGDTATAAGPVTSSIRSMCKSCNHVTTTNDVEDWVYHQLENTTHLLHGFVHASGYGHLLWVNGRDGGPRFLSGCHIMDTWSRLYKN